MKLKYSLKLIPQATTATLFSAIFASLAIPTISAQADTYHAVEPGETLGSVARRYSVTPDALRAANKLKFGDNAQLAAMLLRIPGTNDPEELKVPTQSTPSTRSTGSAARYFGSVTKYTTYTVRGGDTLESIAAQYSVYGQEVSISELRTKNNLTGTPAIGSTLVIPVKTTYGAPSRSTSAQVLAQVSPQSRAITPTSTPTNAPRVRTVSATSEDRVDMSVTVSEEMELPFARAISSPGNPVYQSPNAPRMAEQPKAASESVPRGSTLAARGGYAPGVSANRQLDGARVLQNGEELVTSPTPRVTRTMQATPSNLARVAKVAHGGARIRRLPDADAVTLYRCATGTEIAVLKQKGIWSAILMSDRSTGWMPTRYLQFTGTSVDISSQVITDDDNRSDAASDWRGGYNSNHPAVRFALQWLGTPYVYGGESRNGIDCSSLVQKSFASCGVRLPRVSRDQARVGRAVAPENLQPGDRLYFSASGTHVDHTGIYMGNGLFVHASGRARQVTVSRLTDRRNWNIFVGARR